MCLLSPYPVFLCEMAPKHLENKLCTLPKHFTAYEHIPESVAKYKTKQSETWHRLNIPYRMKVHTKFNTATWFRLIKFTNLTNEIFSLETHLFKLSLRSL